METTPLGFELRFDHDRFLAPTDRELHGVLTVAAHAVEVPAAGGAARAPLAEVIVIDCSESMTHPRTKIAAARRAAAAAIALLPDGVRFALVEGTRTARVVYPAEPRLTTATDTTRAEARRALARLVPAGGTAIGTWLELVRELLSAHPDAIRHALLLTDGRNQHESGTRLEEVLATCAGEFVCDTRGIGDGWEPRELTRIAEVLGGTAAAVRRPDDLAADFRRTMRAALAKQVPQARLRITTVAPSRVLFCRQVHPTVLELTGVPVDHRTVDHPTGSWGTERREYHLCLSVDGTDRPRGENLLVARIDLLVGDARPARPVTVLVHWTDDLTLSSQVDPRVAHFTGQEELSQLIAAGCERYDAGDRSAAVGLLGRAVRLAAETGDSHRLAELAQLVEVVDAPAGRVRLRDDLHRLDLINVAVHSSYTRHDDAAPPLPADGPARICGCGRESPPGARFCERCGTAFEAADGPGPDTADGPGPDATGGPGPDTAGRSEHNSAGRSGSAVAGGPGAVPT